MIIGISSVNFRDGTKVRLIVDLQKHLTFFSLRGLLRMLHDVVIWEYNTIFNTKYFIINSKILPYVVAIVQQC